MTFTGSRLRIARERRGLTKRALAELMGLSERSVQEHECGRATPTEEHEAGYARELRFPVGFFRGPELEMPDPDIASFRSMKSMTAAQRDMALAAGALCIELNRWLEAQGFRPPAPSLPDLRGEDPETAAEALRAEWSLSDKPIRNMIHRLEFHGVRVFSLVQDTIEVDAFSMWLGTTPFTFLNTRKSAERSRFDAAHELGHLVLHRHGAPSGREAELQADAFASSFLMPRNSVEVHAPRMPCRENLIILKRIWGVSVMALLVRMHKLGLISDWRYRSLCIELRDCRTTEPAPLAREKSQVLAKAFEMLRADGITKVDVARSVNLNVSDLEALVFGLSALQSADSTPQVSRLRRIR